MPKNKTPKTLNDFSPVTSSVMNPLRDVWRIHFWLLYRSPGWVFIQSVWRCGWCGRDALQYEALEQRERVKSLICLLLIDFSWAPTCIQPHVSADRLKSIENIDIGFICRLMDFFNREVTAREDEFFFIRCSFLLHWIPQGCVLSPLLFILYSNEHQSHHDGRHLIKFADNMVTVSLLSSDDPEHAPVVSDFIDGCKSSF